MPNTGHITICPYYMSERSRAITCEDVFRRFRTKDEKMEYMKKYCDKDWTACRYAIKLQQTHEKMNEKGETERMLELFKHKSSATRDELKKTTTQLGKMEAKCERLINEIKVLRERDEKSVKKIADLHKENNMLLGNIEKLQKQHRKMFLRWRGEKTAAENQSKKLLEEFETISLIYEGYVAYLLDRSNKEMSLEEFHKWTDEHEYKISHDTDKKMITVTVREKEIEDGDNGSAAEVSKAGDGENEKTEDAPEDTGKETE